MTPNLSDTSPWMAAKTGQKQTTRIKCRLGATRVQTNLLGLLVVDSKMISNAALLAVTWTATLTMSRVHQWLFNNLRQILLYLLDVNKHPKLDFSNWAWSAAAQLKTSVSIDALGLVALIQA